MLLLSERQMCDFQMSDLMGATLMLDTLPLDTLLPAKAMLGDWGYDAGWFRNTLAERGIIACVSAKTKCKPADPSQRHALPAAPQNRHYARQAQ